ncbi:MAG: KOW domain-containing RNA-binding protein [Clostridia bacterium]|nr:KOW domain-containing RNA-binding protein [Clostridia bacterium]
MFQRGQIVLAKAGKEKGCFMVVLKAEERYVLLADGNHRSLLSPKLKNTVHVQKTNRVLKEEQLATDKKIRAALKEYAD